MPTNNIVHVAVAVMQDIDGQYLISKRPKDSHQGGLWEFPGGKVENEETVVDALKRELFEEIGVSLTQATPLIQVHHDYTDKSVLLDVWCINAFSGEAFGKEGQEIRWINKNDFFSYDFPTANLPIINTIQLPDKYMITGEFKDEKELLLRVQSGLNKGIKLIQFRAHNLDESDYFDYAKNIFDICEKENVTLLLNTSVENYKKYNAEKFSHGVHLTRKEICFLTPKSFNRNKLISTSIHNQEELLFAEKNKVDFVVLSPVKKTRSHPTTAPLGWKKFKCLANTTNVPVYALGGMRDEDVEISKVNGAHGISAIGAFWGE